MKKVAISTQYDGFVFFHFSKHICCWCRFRKIQGFYLGNRDSSFKENRVSEDGDKKEGFETIL